MNQQQALQILINAVEVANTKGAFSLKESKLIADAVELFVKPVEEPKKDEKKK